MHLIPLKCTLKIVTMINFVLCFTQQKIEKNLHSIQIILTLQLQKPSSALPNTNVSFLFKNKVINRDKNKETSGAYRAKDPRYNKNF